MPKCSNCGQTTERTEDWACQWCGHPLLSRSFKKISKTYRQLKEENPDVKDSELTEEKIVQPSTTAAITQSYTPLPEPEPLTVPEQIPGPEPVSESKPGSELKPEPELPIDSESSPESADEPESEVIHLPASMPKEASQAESKPAPEIEVIPLPASNPVNTPKPEYNPENNIEQHTEGNPPSTTSELEITVEELLFAYAEDGAAANAKFIDKHMRITGTVDKIEIKDYLDIYYISLNNAERSSLQTIRCVFDKKYMNKLKNLLPGQSVIVSGKFDGSIIDFRMSDCILVG